jgi:hypothetical protein
MAVQLDRELQRFSRRRQRLRGIRDRAAREALLEYLIESMRRVRFILSIRDRDISDSRADPASLIFDPLRAAILKMRGGERDEAFWLVFLAIHFGKSGRTGWRLAQDVYGGLGGEGMWTWKRTSSNPRAFREWLAMAQNLRTDGVPRHFGNHRKYESLAAWSPQGTGAVVSSYVDWVRPPRTHDQLIGEAEAEGSGNARKAFDVLYHSMAAVRRFGRTARFDYLTMVAKIGLSRIEAGSTYITGATGPLRGARLLVGGRRTTALAARNLDRALQSLERDLSLGPQGMQVLEDALCNWQKSPRQFSRFRG